MGLCVSYDAAADGPATAGVVLPSGELREYSMPATVALALEEVGEKGWFLCDADRMEFDGSVTAVPAGEELRPGHIYFVLPAKTLGRCLTPDEVASLAVKASAALVKAATASSASGRRRRRGSVAPLVFVPSEDDYSAEDTFTMATFAVKPTVAQKRRVAYRGGRSPPRFSPDLTAILESE
uniref:Predicted protein n=1 Tax=Hordeum vulgare subsp. vulgare TaxID=112509 RepID=F2EGX2_HORVV|nr:predicted protein [Hordeum vulgare subsp. vulgare]